MKKYNTKIMERAIIANRKHDKGEVRKEMSEKKNETS